MARKPPAAELPGKEAPQWWTHRECQVYLGNISKQKWGRIRLEHQIPSQTDDKGIERFDGETVVDLGERLGLTSVDDAHAIVFTALRDTIEAQTEYIVKLQTHSTQLSDRLVAENDSLRKLRAEEQQAHLNAVIATQQALDMSEDRRVARVTQESQEKRKDAMVAMASPGLEKLFGQLLSSVGAKEDPRMVMLANIVGKLGDEETAFVAVSLKLTKEEYAALQTMRGKTGDDYDAIVAPAIADAEKEKANG